VIEVVTAAGWAPPGFEKLDMDLDIAAGRGLEEAVVQSIQIGAVNSWLRNQPAEVVSAAVASVHDALAPYADGARVRFGAMWLITAQGGPGAVRRSTRERSFEVSNDDFAHFQHCLHGAIGLVAVGVP
jgi:hypothetical protein